MRFVVHCPVLLLLLAIVVGREEFQIAAGFPRRTLEALPQEQTDQARMLTLNPPHLQVGFHSRSLAD